MRSIHWLFVVSVALFVSGIAFVIAGGRTIQGAPAQEPSGSVMTPVATVPQIMSGMAQPSANAIFGAVSVVVSSSGMVETAPETDEEWADLAASAATLAEAGNLLMVEGRAVDDGDWMTMSQAMVDAAVEALEAIEARSPDDVLTTGGTIYNSCETCHLRYWRQ